MSNLRTKIENRIEEILSSEHYTSGRWLKVRNKLIDLSKIYNVKRVTKSITLEKSLEVIQNISDDDLIDVWAIVIHSQFVQR